MLVLTDAITPMRHTTCYCSVA